MEDVSSWDGPGRPGLGLVDLSRACEWCTANSRRGCMFMGRLVRQWVTLSGSEPLGQVGHLVERCAYLIGGLYVVDDLMVKYVKQYLYSIKLKQR